MYEFDLEGIEARHDVAFAVFPFDPLGVDMAALIAEVKRRGAYETTLRAAALEPCACRDGHRPCASCEACRLLVRADNRAATIPTGR